jgi:hypothetical protein
VYLYIYETGKYVQHTRSATQDNGQTDPSLARANEDYDSNIQVNIWSLARTGWLADRTP